MKAVELPKYSLWDRIGNKRLPLSGEIELTERCNLNCVHCYINLPANDHQAKERELSFEEIKRIVDEAVSMGCLWWLITGGEPLLRQDFEDIYLYMKGKGLLITVFTNATLITPKIVEMFKQYPPRDLEITVYGVTRETYERVTRVPGSFESFMRGINLLQKEKVPFTLKAMALRANIGEFEAIKRFGKSMGKGNFRFDPFLHLRLRPDDKRNEEIRSQRLSPEEVVALELSDEERGKGLQKLCEKIGSHLPSIDGHLFCCGAGVKSFAIDPYGFFQLCSTLNHPECRYNLREGTNLSGWHFRKAWEVFVPKIRGMKATNEECIAKCLRCPIINLCMWCPARAYLECGKLDGYVADFCRVAWARAKALNSESKGFLGKLGMTEREGSLAMTEPRCLPDKPKEELT